MWIYFNENTLDMMNINSIEDMPNGVVGFVYKIYNMKTRQFYIGKKILQHKRTLPPLKGKKRKRTKLVVPLPIVKSNTVAFSFVYVFIKYSIRETGFCV